MKIIVNPGPETWKELCRRPLIEASQLDTEVRKILDTVKAGGDKALRNLSLKFDKFAPAVLKVSAEEIDESENSVSHKLQDAIKIARDNIEKFHRSQLPVNEMVETMPGVVCSRKSVPIEKAGLYIPGGSAPLFSTLLMLAIPAKIAACREIIICTPPGPEGKVDPLILFTAKLTGITDIYKAGGAQAIAAMAYGTETIPAVYKIFGPGNQYVTKAKEIVQSEGLAIDIPAGPSEVLIIADSEADPEYIAADLLSQAEHGADSQVVFVSDDMRLSSRVSEEVDRQLQYLPRKDIAARALEKSLSVVFPTIDICMDFSNVYAPEHLIINTRDAAELAQKVSSAGSVFIGPYSCESAGDYASGTNHTLPTNGFARNYSGVSTESFMKKISFQEITAGGIRQLGPVVEAMAEAEQLYGHKNAMSVRLKKLNNV